MKEAVDADQDTENKSCLITGAVVLSSAEYQTWSNK